MYTHSTKFPYARCYFFKELQSAEHFKEYWHGIGILKARKGGYIALLQ